MTNLLYKVRAMCALVVMGLGLAAYSAAPAVAPVTAQQRYPLNGFVDIVVTFNRAESDVAVTKTAVLDGLGLIKEMI